MAAAEPRCKRCGIKMIYIGIGGAAEPICPIDCAPVPHGDKCPGCLSLKIERFYTTAVYWFGMSAAAPSWHCLDCGKVFDEKAIDRR
jgi:DNA-directed RNA polymerase subunit RPC12/RpoP